MATLTLNITPWQFYRLREGVEVELARWENIKLEAELGIRPSASAEGAQILADETRSILEQIKAWGRDNNEVVQN